VTRTGHGPRWAVLAIAPLRSRQRSSGGQASHRPPPPAAPRRARGIPRQRTAPRRARRRRCKRAPTQHRGAVRHGL